MIQTDHSLLGANLFAYCFNNPVNALDPSGFASRKIFDFDDNEDIDSPYNEPGGGGGAGGIGGATISGAAPAAKNPRCPNPWGRRGCPEHQNKITEVALETLGQYPNSKIIYEYRVTITNGNKAVRYADAAIVDQANEHIVYEYIQVGVQNINGKPVWREQLAFYDLENTRVPTKFYPYKVRGQ